MRPLNNLHALMVSVIRLGRGLKARMAVQQPKAMVHLWDFESCPYCRKVRETLSELDIEYHSHPCARGSRNRAVAQEKGGKSQFPFLIDPNTDTQLYESEAIITYLHETYGTGRTQASKFLSPLNTASSILASMIRPFGGRVTKAAQKRESPDEALILYGFEVSPFCRKVREACCELDLDFISRNVAKGSPRRKELEEAGGRVMVPYLIDPNTGVSMYESDDIVAYLHKTYGG